MCVLWVSIPLAITPCQKLNMYISLVKYLLTVTNLIIIVLLSYSCICLVSKPHLHYKQSGPQTLNMVHRPERVWERDFTSVLCWSPSLVPRLSWNANIYRAESLVSFVRKHDVSKIGPNRKATFSAFFNQMCINARCVCYSTPDS